MPIANGGCLAVIVCESRLLASTPPACPLCCNPLRKLSTVVLTDSGVSSLAAAGPSCRWTVRVNRQAAADFGVDVDVCLRRLALGDPLLWGWLCYAWRNGWEFSVISNAGGLNFY